MKPDIPATEDAEITDENKERVGEGIEKWRVNVSRSSWGLALLWLTACSGYAGNSREMGGEPCPRLALSGNDVRYVPLAAICPDEFAPCPEKLLPAAEVHRADVEAALIWLIRNGHRVDKSIPRLDKSVYIVGSPGPRDHPARIKSVKALEGMAGRLGRELKYLRATDANADLFVEPQVGGSLRARLLRIEFGSSDLGMIGACTFVLYRRDGQLTLTDSGCVIR